MNIILIGYRGSGKTTIGRKLASQLWKDFVDLDDLTRKAFDGRPISDIWQEHGEDAFRQAEVAATQDAVMRSDHIIALGGGTLMQDAARQAVIDAPDTKRIYLACEAAELHKRITGDSNTTQQRPALTDQGGGLVEIAAVLEHRDPIYQEVADIVFNVTLCTPEQVVSHLIAQL